MLRISAPENVSPTPSDAPEGRPLVPSIEVIFVALFEVALSAVEPGSCDTLAFARLLPVADRTLIVYV